MKKKFYGLLALILAISLVSSMLVMAQEAQPQAQEDAKAAAGIADNEDSSGESAGESSGDSKASAFFVQGLVHLVGRHSCFAHDVERKGRIQIAASCSHHKTFERGDSHGRVIAHTVFHSAH